MSDEHLKNASRRQFLSNAAVVGAGTLAGGAAHAAGDPLIMETQEYASGLGEGVDATPYGLPIKHEVDG